MIKSKFRRILFAALSTVIVVAAAFFMYLREKGSYPERMRIDAIIEAFLAVKSTAEENVRKAGAIDSEQLYKKWNSLNNGNGQDVTTIIFGIHGEVVIVSDSLKKVIVFTPTVQNVVSWRCSIYPGVPYKTLCDNLQ